MTGMRGGWVMTMAVAMTVLTSTAAQAAEAAPAVVVPATPAVVTSPRRVVVSLVDRKLALVENERVVEVFDVAIGAPTTPSPVGTFAIVTRVTNPTYYRPGKIVPPGATNPIGTRWIGLSQKGYGIHGTDQPRSIGFAKSSGCIRLRNADVERLFEKVRAGDVVELHAERTAEIAKLFGN
jgi:lipoprotein-anchoring transpeptidase ErfK/SrfK